MEPSRTLELQFQHGTRHPMSTCQHWLQGDQSESMCPWAYIYVTLFGRRFLVQDTVQESFKIPHLSDWCYVGLTFVKRHCSISLSIWKIWVWYSTIWLSPKEETTSHGFDPMGYFLQNSILHCYLKGQEYFQVFTLSYLMFMNHEHQLNLCVNCKWSGTFTFTFVSNTIMQCNAMQHWQHKW